MSSPCNLYPIEPCENAPILLGGEGNIEALPYIPVEGLGFYSLWYCENFWARVIFLFTGRISLYVLSATHPPVSLVIGNPGVVRDS